MDGSVAELMDRVRAGDRNAAAELVERFGPQIRRAIRVRLAGSRLRRVMDSEDLLQSVFRIFWEQHDTVTADEPGQLASWLLAVAGNRVAAHGRAAAASKRGGGKADVGSKVLNAVSDNTRGPLSEIAGREMLESLLEKLGPDMRRIAEARSEGVAWEDLALREGTTAEALRKAFTRAVKACSSEPP